MSFEQEGFFIISALEGRDRGFLEQVGLAELPHGLLSWGSSVGILHLLLLSWAGTMLPFWNWPNA